METTATWILTIVGVVGLTTLVNAVTWGRNLGRKQRFFRLRRREPADIVLVTSGYEVGGVDGVHYKRPLTSMGTLQGATMFSRAIGDLKLGKEVAVHISQHLERQPQGDLILLGDPTKNPVAHEFVEDFNRAFPDVAIRRPERPGGGRELWIGDDVFEYEVVPQAQSENPRTDLGLIVFWRNPFGFERRRAIFCAGFTGWGTAAAAHYVLHDFQTHRFPELRRTGHLPALLSRRWPCFLAVIEVTMAADKFLRFRELKLVALPDHAPAPLLRAETETCPVAPAASDEAGPSSAVPIPLEKVAPDFPSKSAAKGRP